ncbi:hypothetical protein [Aliidiomarina quisquiliarum]|uniref:hypothetical protein n=1 Tax=Aliidiomarina quisquiliarum TaxID=2938947 RepID=UPI00208E7757|nr:hypothetical protein [Aliidiomarina quisquiliarum]MCO4322317.1 hypothetical protein [Aliidiomarina quisquiliarum]
MNKHHYTTIQTLALILESRKIRFNRLTNVDDIQESRNYGKHDLSKFIYISCWTTSNEESIPLWKMYTPDMQGVRLTFEDQPFLMRRLDPNEMPGLDMQISDDILSPMTLRQMMSEQCFIIPSFLARDHFGKHVEYVDDVSGIYENAVELKIEEDGKASLTISEFDSLAIHKSKIWSFQEEFRYKLIAFPPPQDGYSSKRISEISNAAITAIYRANPPTIEYIELDICPQKLQSLVVTLGPLCSYADELLVKALLDKYSPTSELRKSNLSGQIRKQS